MKSPRLGMAVLMLGLWLAAAGVRAEEEPVAPPWGEHLEEPEPRIWHRFFEYGEEEAPLRLWVRPEFVLGYTRASNLPPLVTSGLTTSPTPGALGNDFTTITYGNQPLDFKDRYGLRIGAGFAVSDGLAIEASYLTLDGRNQGIQASSPGSPIIARPFFDVVNGQPDSSLTTFPGFLSGSIDVAATSYLQTFELNGLWTGCDDGRWRVRALGGFRQLRLAETLRVGESSTVADAGNMFFGQTVSVVDSFATTNNFFGGQLGLAVDRRFRRFTAEAFGKIAIGTTEERVTIDGGTTFLGTTTPGGLLALSSNIGSFTRNRFGVVPEAGVKVEGAVGRHLALHVGYSFLYIANVVRPADQIDLNVNPNLVPTSMTFGGGGPRRPAFLGQESDYWAHLFSFGCTLRY